MRTSRKFRWWGLYALIPLMIGLMVFDEGLPMTKTGHLVLLAAIALVICGLALAWVERNAQWVETHGFQGVSTYRVRLDTAAGASAQPLVRDAHQTEEKMPANRDAAVGLLTSQTMAEEARQRP